MRGFLIATLSLLISAHTFSQSTAIEKWSVDIDFYKTNLEQNHIDLYHTISKMEFEKEIQKIKSTLNQKSDAGVIIDLMRLTRKIGDGHTAFSLRGVETHLFPIEIYKIDGQWRVIKTTINHKNLLGKIVTKIDGKSIHKIAKKISEIAQYVENEQSEVIRTGEYLLISELLFGLGLTNHQFKAEFTFSNDNKIESKVWLNAISSKNYYENTDFQTFNIKIPEIQKPANPIHDYGLVL
ncbi:MAG: hypothetical protein ACX93O_17145 [Flagellimonas sp.]